MFFALPGGGSLMLPLGFGGSGIGVFFGPESRVDAIEGTGIGVLSILNGLPTVVPASLPFSFFCVFGLTSPEVDLVVDLEGVGVTVVVDSALTLLRDPGGLPLFLRGGSVGDSVLLGSLNAAPKSPMLSFKPDKKLGLSNEASLLRAVALSCEAFASLSLLRFVADTGLPFVSFSFFL